MVNFTVISVALIATFTPNLATAVDWAYEQELVRDWDRFDFDSSGSIDYQEFGQWGIGQGWNGSQISNAIQRSDTNSDGIITALEYSNNLPTT